MELSTMIPAPAAIAPPAKLFVAAKLFSIDGRMPVTLHEIFAETIVGTTPEPPPAGSIAVLSRNGVRVAARIAWVDGQRLGLALDEALEDARLEQLRGGIPARNRPLVVQ